jgi:hypothetical protein
MGELCLACEQEQEAALVQPLEREIVLSAEPMRSTLV